MPAPNLRASVLEAKHQLAAGRDLLRQRHQAGTPGVQICQAMADLFDSLTLLLWESAVNDLGGEGKRLAARVALVPHGGFGRRDVAPYSDVDLMVLHAPGEARHVAPLAGRLFRDLNDAGLAVGNSVRSVSEAIRLAKSDAQVCTSLMESRFLAGSNGLYSPFALRMQSFTRKRLASLLPAIATARRDERFQYGETVYLLEPNIKRSRGALRDIQLLRWVGYARYGSADPESLRMAGDLPHPDYKLIRDARDFLLRLRNELHFHAGRASDQFDRAEQLRVAEAFGVAGNKAVLPVERLMQEYFRHTQGVSKVVERFVESAQPNRWWVQVLAPLFSRRVNRDYWVGPKSIRASRHGLRKLHTNLTEILHLAELANLYDKDIDHETSEAIRRATPDLPDAVPAEAARRFLQLMDQPMRLPTVLRELHDIGVLEKLVPPLVHARSLLQFNEYHKFTIDEHCLLAVEKATHFASDEGPLGRVYAQCHQKRLLHLALLLHDLGKGHEEDHSEVGRRLAADVAARLGLSERDTETLMFLVHKHLMMSHLAFRRDTSDPDLVLKFAIEVGSPEVLQMLFLLTAADLAAVGPGVLNGWKAEVLAELYSRAMEHLSGDRRSLLTDDRLRARREAVRDAVGRDAGEWYQRQVASLPPTYLNSTSPETIAHELRQLHDLKSGDVWAHGQYLADLSAAEYVVATREDVAPGVFHKLAGALAAKGLQIRSAEINTLADGYVLDRFHVEDGDFQGAPPAERVENVCAALKDSLRAASPPPLHQARRYGRRQARPELSQLPTQVRIDNSTSDRFTIVDVFAADRTGLLYTIAKTLYDHDLSVSLAKIGTYLDQVVDVFYVTDRKGKKIFDEKRLSEIRRQLLADLEALERQSVQGQTVGTT